MIIFSGERGSGKTIRLIKDANEQVARGENVLVITMTNDLKQLYRSHGLSDKAKIITYSEYQNNYKNNAKYADASVYVDEAEWFLQHLFKNHVAGITVDKEHITEISRADWEEEYE